MFLKSKTDLLSLKFLIETHVDGKRKIKKMYDKLAKLLFEMEKQFDK